MYLHFFLIYVFHLRQQQVYDREHLASEGGVFPVCLLFFGFFFNFTAHPTGSSKLCPLNRSVVRHTLPNHTYSGELNRKGHMVTGQGSMYNQRITLQQRNRRQKPCQSKIFMFCLFTCRTIYRDGNRYIANLSMLLEYKLGHTFISLICLQYTIHSCSLCKYTKNTCTFRVQ